jgi:hypothetical protein
MPETHDWESEDEVRQRDALRHSMFNSEIPGYSLYEGRLSLWAMACLLAGVVALVVITVVLVRPEPQGPVNLVSGSAACYRVHRDDDVRSASAEMIAAVFEACYVDVLYGDLLVAPIDVPTYRSSAAFLVSEPVEFDRIESTEPFVLDDLGGGLYVVRSGADDLPLVHVRGGHGAWTCPLTGDSTPCIGP